MYIICEILVVVKILGESNSADQKHVSDLIIMAALNQHGCQKWGSVMTWNKSNSI